MRKVVRQNVSFMVAMVAFVALFGGCLLAGAIDIPFHEVVGILLGRDAPDPVWRYIVMEGRLPMAVTATIAGAALALSGLLLQTTFNNPLAGPSILGVSSGASLGVAVVLLLLGGSLGSGWGGYLGGVVGALLGAGAVIAALLGCATVVRTPVMLLIIGIMTGYLAGAGVSLLNFFADRDSAVRGFVTWGLGNFNSVGQSMLGLYGWPLAGCMLISCLLAKPLNAMLLGERYAMSLGVNLRRVRAGLLILAGTMTALVTAFCGPIGFIGLIVPHIARLSTGSSNHTVLIPATGIFGSVVALLCAWLSVIPASGTLPINAITPVVGVPVIVYIILNRRRLPYFN